MTKPFQEFELINWIRERAGNSRDIPVTIGDDAAVVRMRESRDCLVTTDLLAEGTHFMVPPATPAQIGRKAIGVNLSDIAAMAGVPRAAFVSILLPRERGGDFAKEIHQGLLEAASEFDVAIAGGDTNSWDGPCVISVTLLGEPTEHGVVRRNGAKPGDRILATGAFGGSASGGHLTFQPRVREALALNAAADVHAMIDVSDGLAADLHHLLDESNVGACVYRNRIPIADAARLGEESRSPLERALSDGEDFELLFTVSNSDAQSLLAEPPVVVALTDIGQIESERGCYIIDASGAKHVLGRLGWQHTL